MNLIIDKTSFPNVSIETLKFQIEKLSDIEFCEVWLEEDEKSFCLLKSSENAFLMYLQENGDLSFSSLNLDGDSNEFIEFYLSSGKKTYIQKDKRLALNREKWLCFISLKQGKWTKE